MFAIGVRVRMKAPFDALFPDAYLIIGQSVTGAWTIEDGSDWAEEWLEVA